MNNFNYPFVSTKIIKKKKQFLFISREMRKASRLAISCFMFVFPSFLRTNIQQSDQK